LPTVRRARRRGLRVEVATDLGTGSILAVLGE
jgi:hypothetical protein